MPSAPVTVKRLVAALWLSVGGAIACSGADAPLVAFLGDSLTDGWGLPREAAYPALVGREMAARNRPIRVLNAGRGGDKVAQGLDRLAGVLHRKPDVVVIALGINDALRGTNVGDAERDLRRIVSEAKAQGAIVVLAGVVVPAVLTSAHARQFEAMYARVADAEHVEFVPDLLAGAGGRPEQMFPDAIHPNASGHHRLAENVLPAVEAALAKTPAATRAN